MVYTPVLGTGAEKLAGSNPVSGTHPDRGAQKRHSGRSVLLVEMT